MTREKIAVYLGTVMILPWNRLEHGPRADGPVGGLGGRPDQGLTGTGVSVGFRTGHFMRILVRRAGERSPRS